jgi:hypothetical protein
MALNVQTVVFWAVTPVVVLVDANVSEERPASTFMVKLCLLRNQLYCKEGGHQDPKEVARRWNSVWATENGWQENGPFKEQTTFFITGTIFSYNSITHMYPLKRALSLPIVQISQIGLQFLTLPSGLSDHLIRNLPM